MDQINKNEITNEEPRPPFPEQHLDFPGLESELNPPPRYQAEAYMAAGKLNGRVALITGGDSGIGRAVAVIYAREGADVAITHLPEEQGDAEATRAAVRRAGRNCLLLGGDLTDAKFCREAVEKTVKKYGRLDILVSNAAFQARHSDILQIRYEEDWRRTFRTNIDAGFLLCQAALPHLKAGSSIIMTSSINGLVGSAKLIDYSATKGAINAFVKSLAQALIGCGVRVNAVAPGPVWTPLNPADPGLSPDKVSQFGAKVPYGRPAQPEEIAPAYVFLASNADSGYLTGVVLPETGGEIV